MKVAKKTTGAKGAKCKASSTDTSVKGSDKPRSLKVTVTKVPVTQHLMDLPFVSEPPAGSMHGAKKSKKDDGSKGDD